MKPALVGGIVWLLLCVVPLDPNFGIGTIEKLFLLAPLVIVPLGLESGMRILPAAMMVVASFFLPAGKLAGAMVIPWLMLTLWWAGNGLRRLEWRPSEFCRSAGMVMLPVGGVGLLQSRLGLSPLGFREPIVLLVAVHFHYAAFVSPLMASRVVGRNWPVALLVSAGSPVLAAGYVLHLTWLRLTGALMLVAGLCIVSLLIAKNLPNVRPRLARLLLAVAALSVWYSMAYAAVYAVADFHGEIWVAIPQMARTHGVVNALAFSLCGLLGWTLAGPEVQSVSRCLDERAVHSLRN